MDSKSTFSVSSIVGLVAIVLVLWFCFNAMSNNSKLQTGINYLQTGKTSLDYHQLARLDAQQNGISADLFEKQINQESGFNPNAVSPAGAIGIAQFMPSTAQGLGINPYDAVQSLSGAASEAPSQHTLRPWGVQLGKPPRSKWNFLCSRVCQFELLNSVKHVTRESPASLMARYYTKYQSYDKALAAYNAGTDALNAAIANCGSNWRACVPAETDRYIHAIIGY